jgi:serine/threonine protein kinase
MPLSSGTKLGPYEILAPLGAGGMGEVYRAKDTKLGRDVAVKILPAALAQDADPRSARRARPPRRLWLKSAGRSRRHSPGRFAATWTRSL